jgi:hypothetical protein
MAKIWYNPLIKLLLRSPLHGIASSSIILLTYTGRKSGRRISVPLSFVRDGDDFLIVTFWRRNWWRSLQGGAPVSIRLQGREHPATAEAVTDPEAIQRDFGIYLQNTSYLARHLNVDMDEEDNPDPEALARAAEGRLMVRVRLTPE